MMTRNPALGAMLGGLVGVAETMIFAGFDLNSVDWMELIVAVVVGVSAGAIGSAIRIKGALV